MTQSNQGTRMRLGPGPALDILYAVAVNCIWGLAFVIPEYLGSADPAAVALGRYFIYGILSAAILLTTARTINFAQIPWARAFAYAFIGHVGYYLILVWAISVGGVMVVAPIMATLPVSVAIVGNLMNRELAFRRLILPLLLILLGITFLRFYQNSQAIFNGAQVIDMVYGAALALVALSMWTMYAVLNARHLKRIQISSVMWAQAMGLCCLLQAGIAIALWLFVHPQPAQLLQWTANYEAVFSYLAGIVMLGVVVSWFSTQVWNRVSRRLPITVSGQLLVIQSLAAIVYSSWLNHEMPDFIELVCVALVVAGVVWGVKAAYGPLERDIREVARRIA
jgi:drug/metabolite transporter (DMT)-like permease